MPRTEDAVSEAIGSVLLIALVVIGAAIVGTYVASQPLPEKIPKVQFNVKGNDDRSVLYLEHAGGESLNKGSFTVLVNGEPQTIEDFPADGSWSLGERLRIPVDDFDPSNPETSVGLVYTDGSGDTLLRSIGSSESFYNVPSEYDPAEVVNLPTPKPTVSYTDWMSKVPPDGWPTIGDISPSDDSTFGIDPLKVAYVAAHDSTLTDFLPVPPLFVCGGDGNDEREINDALTMMEGGTVILLDGHFKCSDRIRVPGQTRLRGQGSSVTKIEVRAKPGGSEYLPVTLNQPYVTVEGFSLYGNGFVMVTTSHVRVRDVNATSLENDQPGAVKLPASGNGMFFVWATTSDLEDIEFYRCVAHDCHTHGFNMNQYWDTSTSDPNQGKTIGWVRLVFCEANRCGFGQAAGSRSPWITGFDLHEWQDLRHLYLYNCNATDNWESGFHLEPGARYDSEGVSRWPRTISEDINFFHCTSAGNGWRNTDSTAFFLSGFYLSRNTYMKDCLAVGNRNSGFYVHSGENCEFFQCKDAGSTYGWKVCKASSDIQITECQSWNNPRWALWLSFSERITVTKFQHTNVKGDRGYQNILGWYKEEGKYQQPVTNSLFDITAFDSGMPIINRAGSGNTYDLSYG